ncbi:peritrophin-1 [Lingula anatina]|uniref:Peritrophin-1 n=1 Tax=Lingula anatina TaxID=7574 RepID=A0A1S3JP84_LINAN|nr:peritrophin-1 [Lingula anatina]|eukprot:XP_013411809.1 peritrophin-1 [Lingula anatina]
MLATGVIFAGLILAVHCGVELDPPCVEADGIFGDIYDCTKYVVCVGGKVSLVLQCPHYKKWDRWDAQCVVPEKADCSRPYYDTAAYKKEHVCYDGEEADPENCAGFLICRWNVLARMTCPGNLLWDDYKKSCESPDEVQCGARPVLRNEVCPHPSGDYEEPAGCSQYLTCKNYLVYRYRPCPKGLVYNDYAKACDWPRNVQCGYRPLYSDKIDHVFH